MTGGRECARVVLVDDHEMVRTGLKAMLSRFTGQVRVVGEAADAATARRVVAGLDPDIVLADVRLGGETKAKEAGKMRLEGKDYIVKDGDVMHFRFNV